MQNRVPLPVYFGVEVHLVDGTGLHPLDQSIMDEFSFDYVVGALHGLYGCKSLPELADVCHCLHLRILKDRRFDVLGHPYKILPREFHAAGLDAVTSMDFVPPSQIDELISAACQYRKAIEVNANFFVSEKLSGPSSEAIRRIFF